MEAIVTAGGISAPDDPLYVLTGVAKKALIPLAGQPMLSWIVDALVGSGLIEHIVIVGLQPGEITFKGDAPVFFVDSTGSLIDNVLAGAAKTQEINPDVKKILLCASDIPLITPEIVRGFIAECGSQEAEAYYPVVAEKMMEARFPGSKRSYIPFKGGRYCGGDVFLFDIAAVKGNVELLRALAASRKNYWGQVRRLGAGFILSFLLRQMTVHEAAGRVGAKVNLTARVVETGLAELGMDLDKPHHYHLIKACLENEPAPKFVI